MSVSQKQAKTIFNFLWFNFAQHLKENQFESIQSISLRCCIKGTYFTWPDPSLNAEQSNEN